tara:strand:- start:17790 stop:18209 length:420 start_codon:yes stop_codon:yes gene_type:complete
MIVCLDIVGVENEEQGVLIRDVIEQSLDTLMPRRSNPVFIDCHIALDEDMGDAEAMVHQEGDDTFFLAISQSSLDGDTDDLITLLIHEMVHVRQYIRKQITDNSYNNFEEYIKLPYEQEAYRLQEELLDEIKAKVFTTS